MKKIQERKNLNQKKILLRLDLNVPLKNGIITDETRINKIIPIIKFLIGKKSKIIIISHIGRPGGKIDKNLSLKPVCRSLEKKLNLKVKLLDKNLYEIKKEDIFSNQLYKIVVLENIRFYPEEEKNDIKFSKKLASLGEIYVNDAFSCSHRTHASVCKITSFLPSYAGLQFQSELNALKKITTEIKKPLTCIIGGSKISTKINIIKNLIPKLDNLIIVGAMANNILEFKGYKIGKSLREVNCKSIIKNIFNIAKKRKCSIIYPEDVLVGKSLQGKPQIKQLDQIINDDIILDIGEKTIKKIKNIIQNSRTILWNGPAGYFENQNFANGSIEIAKKIIEKNKNKSIYSVAGGGDTVALLNKVSGVKKFNFVSTAGGAFLEYLEGRNLPGINALNK